MFIKNFDSLFLTLDENSAVFLLCSYNKTEKELVEDLKRFTASKGFILINANKKISQKTCNL